MNSTTPSNCPLCSNNNFCGVKDTTKPCWCTQEKVPKELIQQVPQQEKSKSCICQACIKKYHLSNDKSYKAL